MNQNATVIDVQIPVTHLPEALTWLLEQSIPFELYFLETDHSKQWKKNDNDISVTPFAQTKTNPPKTNSLKTSVAEIYERYSTEIGIPPSQEEIANELKISVTTFKNHFKSSYGKTFYQFQFQKKMEYAAELLKQGRKANDVSIKTGYSSPIKFNKMFQKHFGITPHKYQKRVT